MPQSPRSSSRPATGLSLCLGALALAACDGGGSGGSGSSVDFALQSVSIQPNATIQINRRIEFTFTKPVDFASISANTISITHVGGGPATGEFRVKMRTLDPSDPCSIDVPVPNVIVFQPACPLLGDYSDAGLQPGAQFLLSVAGSTSGGPTVQSTAGDGLDDGQAFYFMTATGTQPQIVFMDPVANGGPRALVGDPACTDQGPASYIEVGGDPQNRVAFVARPVLDANLGADVGVPGFFAPLNLYSDASSRVTIALQIDQPVDPSSQNVSPSRIRLEYLADEAFPGNAASWVHVPYTVALEQNCSWIGALVRVRPLGVLPQGRLVRAVLEADFHDIVGNGNIGDTVVGSFRVGIATDPGTTTPGETGDAYTEEFNVGGAAIGSQQDTATLLDALPAVWGGGKLAASYSFTGTGGPGGNFVYRVRALAGGGTTVLNTTFQLITNEDQTATQQVVNGQVDVRDLIIEPGAVLDIRGPNPCVIRASGRIQIDGLILLKGSNNPGVSCVNCPAAPQLGAIGNAGGGRGGAGNYLTTQSTPQGEAGFGPFNVAGGGGQGGETSYGSFSAEGIGAAGGGGGSFAIDVPRLIINGTLVTTTLNPACPDQTIIGLDAENGADGSTAASGAISGPGVRPKGGLKGPRPFVDANPSDPALAALDDDSGSPSEALFHLNDFWGTMRVGNQLLTGELGSQWAGAGGGGGGNVAKSTSFPTTPYTPLNNLQGAGGGGGGGALTLLCPGDIVFGAAGRIDASGGTGGGGKNTSNSNRIGGASGGGSGGHVILQSGGNIDFRLCQQGSNLTPPFNLSTGAGIFARGGQGGESSRDGFSGAGGAAPPGIELSPAFDLLPPNSYPSALSPCGVLVSNQGFVNTLVDTAAPLSAPGQIRGVGGDGGPGVIQLHVSDLTRILPPADPTKRMRNLLRPPPVGTTQLNIETPTAWRQLLPVFSRESKALSKWIPLGSTSVPPTGSTPDPIEFFFAGTNTSTGLVDSTVGVVPALPPILSGTLVPEPNLPFITADERSVVFDATTITDDVYLRNPALIGQFELEIAGSTVTRFDIATAAYDVTAGTLRVTVTAGGMPLDGLAGTARVNPRFFRVSTGGTLDALPASGTIKIEFQAAPSNASGLPSETMATPWATDVMTLNATVNPANTDLRYLRFRVTFEIGVGQPTLPASTPIPSLEFLRAPFRF